MQAVNKDDLLKKVGENLRNIRKGKQMEIKEVGKKLEITPQAYGNIENGKVDLSMSRLVAIANVFEVSVDEILNVAGNITNYNLCNNSGGNNIGHADTISMTDYNLVEYFKSELELLRAKMKLMEDLLQKKK